tara:strand:- start:145 stop:639 length:495 start_codon:yes stop_codon:yes gene_type:complete
MAAAPIPWSSATAPIDWDVIGINWNTAAKANTGTYGALSDQAMSAEGALSPEITFGALADETATGILSLSASGAFGSLGDISSGGGLAFSTSIDVGALADQTLLNNVAGVESVSWGALADYVNSVNHEETVSVEAVADWSSLDGFLWNEVADVATTWTKVEYPN